MKLKSKLILFLSVFITAFLAIIFFYSYYEFKNTLINQTHKNLTTIVEGFEGQILLFFEKNKIQAVDWSSDGYIKNEFEKILETGDAKQINALADYIKTKKYALGTDFFITDIFDLNGKAVVSTDFNRINHMESKEELDNEYGFSRAAAASYSQSFVNVPTIEKNEPGHEIHQYMWHFSVPLYSLKFDKIIGIMVNHVPNEIINDILSGKKQEKLGALTGTNFKKRFASGEVYLVNNKKVMITSSKFIENSIFNQLIGSKPVKECLENKKEFTGSYFNYLNNSVEGASMCFIDYGLTLVIEAGTKEILADLENEKLYILGIGFLMWVFGIIFIFLFSHVFLKNILLIKEALNKAKNNNFGFRLNIKSKDETKDLADNYNLMMDHIVESHDELRKAGVELMNVNSNLERKVKERTGELEKLRASLEQDVIERTKELKQKLAELEKFKELTVGRELKMIELKKKIEELENKH